MVFRVRSSVLKSELCNIAHLTDQCPALYMGNATATRTDNLAYLIGFITGDGNLSSAYLVRAVEENEEFINSFSTLFDNEFGRRPKVYFDRFNGSFVAYLHSKSIWQQINEAGVPLGDTSRIVDRT